MPKTAPRLSPELRALGGSNDKEALIRRLKREPGIDNPYALANAIEAGRKGRK